MIDIEAQIAEAAKYFYEAQDEFKKKQYHLVIGNLLYALHILEESGKDDHELIGEIYHLLVRSHLELKHYEKVYSYWESCYSFYLNRDLYKVCDLHILKGALLSRDANDRQAICSYQKVIQLLKEDLTEEGLPIRTKAYYNLANCYIRLGKYEDARNCYLKSYRLEAKWGSPGLKGKILMGLGVTYQYHQQEKSTLRCYQKALQYIKPTNYVTYGRLLHNLGDMHLQVGKMEEARYYYEESIKGEAYLKFDRARVISSIRGIATTYVNTNVQMVKAYSMKALEMILEQGVTKFTPIEEKDLGYIFKLLCYWMYQERKLEECKLYMAQARSIFRKYGLGTEIDKLDHLADQLSTRR